MKLSNITPEQAHQVAMAAVHQSREGSSGKEIARIYREAYLSCNEEPEVTGVGNSAALSEPKNTQSDFNRMHVLTMPLNDPLHPDYKKNFG